MAYLGTDTWDTREAYLEWVGQIARGTVNLSVKMRSFAGTKGSHREDGKNRMYA